MIRAGKFRFCLIEPERTDAQSGIILFALLPDIFSGTRVCRIHKNIISVECHLDIDSAYLFDEESLLFHFLKVFTVPFHLWPERYHGFDAHFVKLCNHFFRFREIFFVEAPVPAVWPVIVVDNQNIKGNPSLLIFSGDFQNFFLIVVAEFTLPEAKSVLWHHRDFSGAAGKLLFYLCRGIAGGDPVVHLFG